AGAGDVGDLEGERVDRLAVGVEWGHGVAEALSVAFDKEGGTQRLGSAVVVLRRRGADGGQRTAHRVTGVCLADVSVTVAAGAVADVFDLGADVAEGALVTETRIGGRRVGPRGAGVPAREQEPPDRSGGREKQRRPRDEPANPTAGGRGRGRERERRGVHGRCVVGRTADGVRGCGEGPRVGESAHYIAPAFAPSTGGVP